MEICICGGGNLGHVMAGFMASLGQDNVSLLTRRPRLWADRLIVDTPYETLEGRLARVSDNPADVVAGADMVLLCLPGWSIGPTLELIAPWLGQDAAVGSVVSSTGFYFEAIRVLPRGTKLFGFQRVPFIARTEEYGRRAALLGYKKKLVVGTENIADCESFRAEMSRLTATATVLAGSMYEVSLTNSNPLLHPARLFSLWKDWRPGTIYGSAPLFYEEWTEEAAQIYINLDSELQSLLALLPVQAGCIPTVLDYYESHDAASLAAKLRSIEAFKGIKAPMKQLAGGFVPDFGHRYFTEDFPFGLKIVRDLAASKHLYAPTVEQVCGWGMDCVERYSLRQQ